MLPELIFKDDDQGNESLGLFIDKSLQLHKVLKLTCLVVEPCHVDVDVRKWVEKAVNHGVKKLKFKLLGTAQPTTFPYESLHMQNAQNFSSIRKHYIVDVSFPVSLPSLLHLELLNVLFKDEDSLSRLLSSSHVLELLMFNDTNFTVKVSTLKVLTYNALWLKEDEDEDEDEEEEDDHFGSLVIGTPVVIELLLGDYWGGYCSLIENMSCLDETIIRYVPKHNPKYLTCLSSVKRLMFAPSESMVLVTYPNQWY